MAQQAEGRAYAEEEIKARLVAELPGGTTRTADPSQVQDQRLKGTQMVITSSPPGGGGVSPSDIAASYAFVIVKLMNHAAKGVTDKDSNWRRSRRS